MITEEALRQVTQQCLDREQIRKRSRTEPRAIFPSEEELAEAKPSLRIKADQSPVYNPEEPLNLRFPILKEYLEAYENQKK